MIVPRDPLDVSSISGSSGEAAVRSVAASVVDDSAGMGAVAGPAHAATAAALSQAAPRGFLASLFLVFDLAMLISFISILLSMCARKRATAFGAAANQKPCPSPPPLGLPFDGSLNPPPLASPPLPPPPFPPLLPSYLLVRTIIDIVDTSVWKRREVLRADKEEEVTATLDAACAARNASVRPPPFTTPSPTPLPRATMSNHPAGA